MALGLRPGMTLADARARIPKLEAHPHDPGRDAALLTRMAGVSERWTPLVALDPPDGLLLDVTGVAHLFGGETALHERILAHFRRAGFATQAALAGTPDAARALARLGRSCVVPPGGEEAALRPLPIAGLGLDAKTRAGLAMAGLKRIGDLADLPSAPLAARFGAELPRLLARVLGREDVRITPLNPAPACRVERRFAEPIAQAGAIEAALVDLIGEAAVRLEAAGEGGRAFEALFFRADGGMQRLRVETSRPSRDPRTVLGLLRERLDALADPLDPGFGFDLIRLDVPMTEPLRARQSSLDGETGAGEAVSDLVDRLVARFGAARVLRFALSDSHDPVRAARLVPSRAPNAPDLSSSEPGEPPLRPLQLFEPPQPIEALAEVPDGPPVRFRWGPVAHRVVHAEGPERIASEWWRDPTGATRDYYRVEDEAGGRFWVFRQFRRGEGGPRWFLHGLFA